MAAKNLNWLKLKKDVAYKKNNLDKNKVLPKGSLGN